MSDTSVKGSFGSLVISVSGSSASQSEFEVATGRSVRIDIPETFGNDLVSLAANDIVILKKILEDKPNDVSKFVKAVSAGQYAEVNRMTKELGVDEDSFVKKGGGQYGLLIVVAVIAIGAALYLESDTPPTTQPR